MQLPHLLSALATHRKGSNQSLRRWPYKRQSGVSHRIALTQHYCTRYTFSSSQQIQHDSTSNIVDHNSLKDTVTDELAKTAHSNFDELSRQLAWNEHITSTARGSKWDEHGAVFPTTRLSGFPEYCSPHLRSIGLVASSSGRQLSKISPHRKQRHSNQPFRKPCPTKPPGRSRSLPWLQKTCG